MLEFNLEIFDSQVPDKNLKTANHHRLIISQQQQMECYPVWQSDSNNFTLHLLSSPKRYDMVYLVYLRVLKNKSWQHGQLMVMVYAKLSTVSAAKSANE